ncbi:hypothetical protein O181_013847 [Austropuccinia psidii MF-1]|uniref:Uncharacterized protein n=1 Tax=Austropuccinia psidii MF-1 TaxID=1389203 RepID=A0A9Q3GPB7_9BASI|nr:hypothetical protein [Austropuccinia psidii MF-1]
MLNYTFDDTFTCSLSLDAQTSDNLTANSSNWPYAPTSCSAFCAFDDSQWDTEMNDNSHSSTNPGFSLQHTAPPNVDNSKSRLPKSFKASRRLKKCKTAKSLQTIPENEEWKIPTRSIETDFHCFIFEELQPRSVFENDSDSETEEQSL